MSRKHHIGGCGSCGFSPDETLAGVCARNENVDVDEAIAHIWDPPWNQNMISEAGRMKLGMV